MTEENEQERSDILTLHCEGFSLPLSPLLSEKTRKLFQRQASEKKPANTNVETTQSAPPTREEQREQFYQSKNYQHLISRYKANIELTKIAGVTVEVITPSDGVSEENFGRVLINFHGGSFQAGSQTLSQSESIPIATLGKIKVISVDYRMYPEHRSPAALDDAQAVYQALLQDYSPECIGVFGSSSGAQLTAQLIYRLQVQKLPLPAAVAMIAEAATRLEGDSIAFSSVIYKAQCGLELADALDMGYFENVTPDDPSVYPALSDESMAAFPPSFLASSTRDICLSPVVATHRKLVQAGVEAELQLWEGLDHCFHYNPELPESEELHRNMLAFFERYLPICTN